MTQLTVKALRHYHDVGLVVPDQVDPATGYRYYLPEQVATAAVVRRLRELDMPIPDVRAVLAATPEQRNSLIAGHLARLETQLAATGRAVESLRAILERPPATSRIQRRTAPATPVWLITATVDRDQLTSWWEAAMEELRAAAGEVGARGVPGALFAFDIFERDRGEVTVFLPVGGLVGDPAGRIRTAVLPAADLVVLTHHGRHDDADLAYSELGAYATRHEISVAAPLREYYRRFYWDTEDLAEWETELCWPVFRADA
ncbi:MerR family transcriptional regulator [Mycolicibacterium confluentis]|uniref:MerR family transcriptional regulator n=2 Tax=Mycolicibacterium confluentis TaxID=28047 RepID=A0A7I7XZB4_9MYCO|nr:MerR family transcriptional regulator [Mycolicibacterium confluentis]BBZ34303.1 MerR family transcriptional regulator [Mycolicibacterium confluentis]